MKTVAELSQELNISTQAVYKKIKACNLTVANGGLVVTNRINHVTPHGEAILKGDVQPEIGNHETNHATETIELVAVLKEQIKIKDDQIAALQGELTAEREHARALTDELVTIAKQGQVLQLRLTTGNVQKQGLLARLFGRNAHPRQAASDR